jgi:hypothetical protein
MYLIEQKRDGKRFAATPNDIHSYQGALNDAEDNLRRNLDTVALYLYRDNGADVVRTYVRSTKPPWRTAEVLYGYHEWPAPPTVYPGVLPQDRRDYWLAEGEQARDRLRRYQVWDESHVFKWPHGRQMGKAWTYAQTAAEVERQIAYNLNRVLNEGPRLAGMSVADIHDMRQDLADARSSLQHEHDALVSLKAGLRDLVSRFTA